MSTLMKRHPLIAYFSLAMGISWLMELPLIASAQGWIQTPVPFWLHYLASFGPLLASVSVTAAISGTAGLRELGAHILLWRVGWKWALVSILSPVAVFALAMPVTYWMNGRWPDLALLGQVNYLPYLGVWVLPFWLATYGFGEEIGWRGFALPRLQKSLGVSRATLILGMLWLTWHVPSFFYNENYRGMNPILLPGLMIGILSGAVLFTWIYNHTGESILMVAIFHAMFDLLTSSKAGGDAIPAILSAAVIVAALVITRVNQPWGFRFTPKAA